MNKLLFLCLFNIYLISNIIATDIIKYEKGQSNLDVRINYKLEILTEALKHTVDKYGDFKILTDAPTVNNLQAINQLQSGDNLNVFIASTNLLWEEKSIPIKIPIRKGLLSYRLLLINKDHIDDFKNINNIEDLKRFTVGLRKGWSLNQIMEDAGFTIIPGSNYDGLFLMLNNKRFDFLPRGVNEIFGELEQRKKLLENVIIEPHLALYIPGPTYIFVSPRYPKIAQRLKEGLELMIEDGSFDIIFNKHYSESIEKADLLNRNIINIENLSLPNGVPFDRKELWFSLLK